MRWHRRPRWPLARLGPAACAAATAYRAARRGLSWLAGFLGVAGAGGVAVPVDPASPAERIRLVLDDCEPAVTLAEPDVDASGWPTMTAGAGARRAHPGRGGAPDDLAYLVYSSGSTGRPKGAMHAHRDMATGIDTYARHVLELSPEDRCHSAARLFTSLGFGNGFFRVLGSGATAVLSGARPNPRGTLGVVRDQGVTVLTGVPTFWAQLTEYLSRHPDPDALTGVRLAVASGDSLPAPVAARFEELTGLRILEGLGCSECSNVLISTRAGQRGGGTLGQVVPGVEVELRDPEGRVCDDGEPGRLWIRSASTPAATGGDRVHPRPGARRLDPHGRRAGRDEDEYRHVGRVDDLFKVDARWVSPSRWRRACWATRRCGEEPPWPVWPTIAGCCAW
ncbi:MAG: AMP-binding protein [Thermoleophilia bacterium]